MLLAIIMFGALSAALGATCSKPKDAQSLTFCSAHRHMAPGMHGRDGYHRPHRVKDDPVSWAGLLNEMRSSLQRIPVNESAIIGICLRQDPHQHECKCL